MHRYTIFVSFDLNQEKLISLRKKDLPTKSSTDQKVELFAGRSFFLRNMSFSWSWSKETNRYRFSRPFWRFLGPAIAKKDQLLEPETDIFQRFLAIFIFSCFSPFSSIFEFRFFLYCTARKHPSQKAGTQKKRQFLGPEMVKKALLICWPQKSPKRSGEPLCLYC